MIKSSKIFWGIMLIVVAVLLILDAIGILAPISGILGEISLFRVAIGLGLLYFIITRLVKGKIASIFIPLSFIFMLFERNVATVCGLENENIISNWLLLLCAIIISIGVGMISGNFRFVINGRSDRGNFGNSVEYIDSSDFSSIRVIENNLGAYNVHFENIDQYNGEGTLKIENNLGSVNINVPSSWRIEMNIENNLGHTTQAGNGEAYGPKIRITGENNLGHIQIRRT